MLTDTSGIRHLAQRMRERAAEIRAEGAWVRRRADDVPWQGQAAEAMRLSARGYTRIQRVARTIADLAGAETVGRVHVAEALSYRRQAPRN